MDPSETPRGVDSPHPQANSPEARLAASRAALRRRLGAGYRHPSHGAGGTADEPSIANGLMEDVVKPATRELVRRHPYAMLAGAACAGAMVVWWRPWRGLAGSLVAGVLVRHLGAASVALGRRGLGRLLHHDLEGGPQAAAPAQPSSSQHPA